MVRKPEEVSVTTYCYYYSVNDDTLESRPISLELNEWKYHFFFLLVKGVKWDERKLSASTIFFFLLLTESINRSNTLVT